MKTITELQAELDSALRAVTSLAAERNAARAEAEDLRGRLAQDHGIIQGMEEAVSDLNDVNDNLVLLLRRTSRRLPPFDPLRVQTVDYLKRIGQAGNELRATEDWQDQPQDPRCKHGIAEGHCAECPTPEEIEVAEREQAERQAGSRGIAK